MNQDIAERAIIDPNLSSYEQFFDREWCRCIYDKVDGTPIADAVNTLIVSWRATNGAHVLPCLMVNSLRAFDQGRGAGNLRYRASYSEEVVKGLVGKLNDRMHYHLNLDQRLALKRVVAQIEKEAHEALRADS